MQKTFYFKGFTYCLSDPFNKYYFSIKYLKLKIPPMTVFKLETISLKFENINKRKLNITQEQNIF